MDNNFYDDEIIFDVKIKNKKKKTRALLDDLNDITSEEVALPSSLLSRVNTNKKEKKEKDKLEKEKKKEEDNELDPDWLTTITSFKTPKSKKKSKNLFDGFDPEKKKKNKKKVKEGQTISHKKDFEPEMILLRNLQMEQNKFVDSLQKRYDQMEGTKSTARGVGKYTTDLVNAITSARSVSMQLVDKIISTKKTIADLDFKERKEFGNGSGSEQVNMANYASTYLKQVMSAGRNNVVGNAVGSYDSQGYVDDSDDEDLFSSIDESLGETDRSEDVEKYLKYENDNIQVKVIWRDELPDDSPYKYDFIAYNYKGEEVPDYPLPEKTKLNINRTTGKASDIYGAKYDLIVV